MGLDDHLHRYPGGELSPFPVEDAGQPGSSPVLVRHLASYLEAARGIASELLPSLEGVMTQVERFSSRLSQFDQAYALAESLRNNKTETVDSKLLRVLPTPFTIANRYDAAAEIESRIAGLTPEFLRSALQINENVRELLEQCRSLEPLESRDAVGFPDPAIGRHLRELRGSHEQLQGQLEEVISEGTPIGWQKRISFEPLLGTLTRAKELLVTFAAVDSQEKYSKWPEPLRDGFRSARLNRPSSQFRAHPGKSASEVLLALDPLLDNPAPSEGECLRLASTRPREFIQSGLDEIRTGKLLAPEDHMVAVDIFLEIFQSQDGVALELQENFGFAEPHATALALDIQSAQVNRVMELFERYPTLRSAMGPICREFPELFRGDQSELESALPRIAALTDPAGEYGSLKDLSEFNPARRPDNFFPASRLDELLKRANQIKELPDKIEALERDEIKSHARLVLDKIGIEHPALCACILTIALEPGGSREGALRRDILQSLAGLSGDALGPGVDPKNTSRLVTQALRGLIEQNLVIASHRDDRPDHCRYRLASPTESFSHEWNEFLDETRRVWSKFAKPVKVEEPAKPELVQVPTSTRLDPHERKLLALIDLHSGAEALYHKLFRPQSEGEKQGEPREPDITDKVFGALDKVASYVETFREVLAKRDALAAAFKAIAELDAVTLNGEIGLTYADDYLTDVEDPVLQIGTEREALKMVAGKLTGPVKIVHGQPITKAKKHNEQVRILRGLSTEYAQTAPRSPEIQILGDGLEAFRKEVRRGMDRGLVTREIADQVEHHGIRFWQPLVKDSAKSREDFESTLALFETRFPKYRDETMQLMSGLGYSVWIRMTLAHREVLVAENGDPEAIEELTSQLTARSKLESNVRGILFFDLHDLVERGLISPESETALLAEIGHEDEYRKGKLVPEILPRDRLTSRASYVEYRQFLHQVFGSNASGELEIGSGVAGRAMKSIEAVTTLGRNSDWAERARSHDANVKICDRLLAGDLDDIRRVYAEFNSGAYSKDLSEALAVYGVAHQISKDYKAKRLQVEIHGSQVVFRPIVIDALEPDITAVRRRIAEWKELHSGNKRDALREPFHSGVREIEEFDAFVRDAAEKGILPKKFYEQEFEPAIRGFKEALQPLRQCEGPFVQIYNGSVPSLINSASTLEQATRTIRSHAGFRINMCAWAALAPTDPIAKEAFLDAATQSLHEAYIAAATKTAEVKAWLAEWAPSHLDSLVSRGEISVTQRGLMDEVCKRVLDG